MEVFSLERCVSCIDMNGTSLVAGILVLREAQHARVVAQRARASSVWASGSAGLGSRVKIHRYFPEGPPTIDQL